MTRLWHDVREMALEQREYRELLYRLVAREITIRYKQTVMGLGWALFMPVINTVVFVIFMRVAPIEQTVPYPLYAYCGLTAWNLFASSIRFSVNSLTGNPSLVTKVYFPREIFTFSTIAVSVVDFAIASLLMIAMMAYFQVAPSGWAILLLPVVLGLQLVFTAAVGLFLSMANLFYRDVKYLMELIITVWMFLSSVLYPIELMGGTLATVIRFNPMTPIIDGYRTALFGVSMNDPVAFFVTAVIAPLLLVGAWLVFHRAEYTFAENL